MNPEEIQIKFEEAVSRINAHLEPFPADFLLRLYAYYKRANNNRDNPDSKVALINAFKANALFQTQGMTVEEAKLAYINAVKNYFLYRK